MPEYFIGTAGWSYKDWLKVFYPKAQSGGFDWLCFYSHYFNFVEVNSSYYTYLSPKIISGWIEKVSDSEDFIFSVKLHQDFTHRKNFDQQKIKSVCYNLDVLGRSERLAGLLVQFPYSFTFNDASVKYISRLYEIFQNYKLFIELRHSSWNNEHAFSLFSKYKLIFCTIDQPKIGRAISFNPVVTGNEVYIRLHGRNAEGWKASIENFGKPQSYAEQSGRYEYLYKPGEITEFSQQIKQIGGSVKRVYIIFNNHPAGKAIANAFDLSFLLNNENKLDIPQSMQMVFKNLQSISFVPFN